MQDSIEIQHEPQDDNLPFWKKIDPFVIAISVC
jgi:hypothetical protein